jgi:fatty-acyl-CoA synthase
VAAKNVNSSLKAWMRALEATARIERERSITLPRVIEDLGRRFGNAPALLMRDEVLSYAGLAEASRQYARWGLAQGLMPGDVVCLLMPNCPHYMALWLGLSRIGVTSALINTHLTGDSLAHSINIVSPRCIIVDAALAGALEDVHHRLPVAVKRWARGAGRHHLPRLELEVAGCTTAPLDDSECALPTLDDRALYIYTSGTTGLPKAAVVTHHRIMQWSHWFAGMMNTRPTDRMYDCLPMYHSIGGVVAPGVTLVGGGAVVLRERFSASEFWRDISGEHCTLFQYIGELCRYLLRNPVEADEVRHGLRLCCGNGLRPDVWKRFQTRFRIPQILEYYASTEGSFSLYNCEGRPGAIGRIPPFLAHRMPVAVVRFDEQSQMPSRNETGRCLRCAVDEAGEAIAQIHDGDGHPTGRYEGYSDREATERKVLRDVFAPGDAWYRSGDLMRQDSQGFFYFVDRVGDTFRWKGENVSTGEVEAVIAACPSVTETVVYGVALPGVDGRAGMAALVVERDFDFTALRAHLVAHLPEHSRPLFLRLVPSIERTGTFKLRKQDLARQGIEIAGTGDLYFDDRQRGEYVRLDAQLAGRIRSGEFRF